MGVFDDVIVFESIKLICNDILQISAHVYILYEAYSEINVRWASMGSPVKMAT